VNKSIRTTLLSLIALVILGTLVFFLTRGKDEPSEKHSDSSDNPLPVTATVFTAFSDDDVVLIRIANQKDDGYTITTNPLGITEIDERTQDSKAVIPYNEGFLLSTVNAAANLSATMTVEENAEDLSKYGLSTPLVTIEASFVNGDTFAFAVGEPSPDAQTYYFMSADDNTVYAVDANRVNPFFNERHDYIERLAFPQYNSHDAPLIKSVTIERRNGEGESEEAFSTIVIEAIPEKSLEELKTFNSHRLTAPVNIEVDPEKSTPVIFGIFGLTASKVLWVAPDEVDYELTGLSNPLCSVEVVAGDDTFLLNIGNEFQGGYYGQSNCAPELLLLFDPASLPWLTVTQNDLVSDTFLTPYIYSLDALEIIIFAPESPESPESENVSENKRLYFEIEGDTDNNAVYLDQKLLSDKDRDNFGLLYQFILSMRGEKVFTGDDECGDLIARIVYYYRDGTSNNITFSKSNNRRSVIEADFNLIFTCRDIYTTRFLENVQSFLDGGEIILDW